VARTLRTTLARPRDRCQRYRARSAGALRLHADKRYSFCDVLSFVAMEQLGITEALAFDDDFRSYGKIILVR
jgi:predicted nucleic acid-binding protein